MEEIFKKKLIVKYSRLLVDYRLSPIRSGNISLRHTRENKTGLLISPSGKKNEALKTGDIVFVEEKGNYNSKLYQPSSELNFHKDIYNNFMCNAVVHAHSKYAVILSCLYKKIPSFHYMIALAGGNDIKTAEYAIYGSKKLSTNIIKAMKERKACLISNHGQVTIGNTLEQAFELAQEVELLCEYYYKCKLIGKPKIISNKEMDKVIKKINNYKNN